MSIKKLAGQTLWYGVPRIFSKFLSFGVSLLGFSLFDPSGSAPFTLIYALIPFFNILFTYGLETSYFRFATTYPQKKLYNTLLISIVCSTILFSLILWIFRQDITHFLELDAHPQYVNWMIGILFFDTICTIPMVRLRQEEKPRKYAFINMFSIVINVAIIIFFYYVAKPAYEENPYSILGQFFDPTIGIGYFFLANMIASFLTIPLLYKEFLDFRWEFDKELWKKVLHYSYPLVIVGFGGMINEMISRLIYLKVRNVPTEVKDFELGVFGANYKLAVLITIFIQIFRMAAEPYFFNQSKHEGAQRTYARVMKFFVIACCFMFLGVVMFLEVWKVLIANKHPEYAQGLQIVPILSMASIFLGIYYNLSIWYKLLDRNMTGAWITLAGAAITIVLNFALVPHFYYYGAAWATFICYAFMMIVCYRMGQKHYPVPYATKKLIAYIVIVSLLYAIHELIIWPFEKGTATFNIIYFSSAFLLIGVFTFLIFKVEKKELSKLPYVGKFIKI
ncbi:oligosaccharide flippase family protein [Gynurincola endophyticus]|uniref:oligosaccharide flippase family protein n=1 Tax=Gynurincola endophyticus TaxID=2479004 RepID=UPI000F8D2584|nr:polysaccharide biosynthesis C-terminal domain-containing protein [Gynurincola endophyticus]